MPRAKYLNLSRHAITLPQGQPLGPGGDVTLEHTRELQTLVDEGTLFLVEHIAEPEGPPQPVSYDSGVQPVTDGIPHESVLGTASIQQSPPPEQPAEPSPPGAPLDELDKPKRRRRGGEE